MFNPAAILDRSDPSQGLISLLSKEKHRVSLTY